MKVDYILNGTAVNPVNRDDIFIEINHDQESVINQARPHVGISNIRFAREDIKRVMQELNNAPGITEGIPFNIVMKERSVTSTVNMYVDCMELFKRSNDGVTAAIKMLQSLDWLDDRVDAFTFEYLYNKTNVTPFVIDGVTYPNYQQFFDRKCIYIPYVVSEIPNWHDAFLAVLGMTFIATQFRQVSKSILQWAAPIAGVGLVLAVAQLVLEIAYAVLLIITMIGLIEQLIACLIQPLKYHGAMLVSDLLKVTCAELGLQFQSSIWDAYPYNQIAFLPEKYNAIEGNASSFNVFGVSTSGFGTKGYTSPAYAPGTPHDSQTQNIQHGYFNGTGGDFLRLVKTFCNGKIIIPDQTNKMLLERRDYYPATNPYQLPDVRRDWNGYNLDELIATTILRFQADLNERNCIDHKDPGGNAFYTGTILQATHQQIVTNNKALVCLKGLREINISCARGVAKDSLTFVEKVVKDLEVVWHVIENIAIVIIDVIIAAVNVLIIVVNIMIAIWNAIIFVLKLITDIINDIIDAINTIPGIDIDNITVFDHGNGTIGYISTIDPVNFVELQSHSFDNRIGALLIENDMLTVPKLLLVDTQRSEFTSRRIAYLHTDNAATVNAKYLWDHFYFIDAFVGTSHNRFTKIAPALNTPEEKNRVILSMKDFMNLVSNPQFKDSFGETCIADSIQWFIEQNGAAEFEYRKKGWLADPINSVTAKRIQEIAINLELKISLPNGQ